MQKVQSDGSTKYLPLHLALHICFAIMQSWLNVGAAVVGWGVVGRGVVGRGVVGCSVVGRGVVGCGVVVRTVVTGARSK
jgi:hypothetical protein